MADKTITAGDLLSELAEVRREIDAIESQQLTPLRSREATIRTHLQELMQRTDAKTVEGAGFQALRANRTSVVISDKDELTAALKERGLYDQCVRLDLNEAKKVGIENEMPGVEKQTSEVFTIRSAKS